VYQELQEGHDGVPPEVRRNVRTTRIQHPVGFSIEAVDIKECHRIARILEVHDPDRSPTGTRDRKIVRLALETDERAIPETRKPVGRARISARRNRTPDLASKGRAAPYGAIDGIADNLKELG